MIPLVVLLRRAYAVDRRTLLLLAAFVLFYGVGDVASTWLAFDHLGTMAYEASAAARTAYDAAGYLGVVLLKAGAVALVILLAPLLRFSYPYSTDGMLAGASIGGIVITVSNAAVPLIGRPLSAGPVDSLAMTILLLSALVACGLGMDVGERIGRLIKLRKEQRERREECRTPR